MDGVFEMGYRFEILEVALSICTGWDGIAYVATCLNRSLYDVQQSVR